MFSPAVIDAVRSAARIEDVAGDLTALKPASGRLFGLCPLHRERTPSFSVDPDAGLFYCFGCGRGGDAIALHSEVTGDDFRASIEALARRYGIEISEQRDEHSELRRALSEAQDFFARSFAGSLAEQYLSSRGISAASRERYGIGYAPRGWRPVQDFFAGRYKPETLIGCGLAVSSGTGKPVDRFRHRVTFPLRDQAGRVCGFSARAIDPSDQPKYLNSSEGPVFKKGALLFGYQEARRLARSTGTIVLCEGQLDAIAADACGFAGVASLGTAVTPEQLALLTKVAGQVMVAFDPDDAGKKAALKALPLLLRAGLDVRRVEAVQDLAGDLVALGSEVVALAISSAPDAIMLEAEAPAKEPRERAALGHRLRDLVNNIPDAALRAEYAKAISERFGISLALTEGPRVIQAAQPIAGIRPLEALALELLLSTGAELPDPDDLPHPLAFAPPYREPYAAFRELYAATGLQPTAAALARALPPAGPSCAVLASLRPDTAAGSISGVLGSLARRHARASLQFAGEGEREHHLKILAQRY